MTTLDPTLATLDGLDEKYHELYEPREQQGDDGEKQTYFELRVNGGIPNVDRLKKALDKERRLKKEVEKRLDAFGDVTPDNIQTLMDDNKILRAKTAETRDEFDKELKNVENGLKTQITELETSIANKDAELVALKLDEQIKAAAMKAGIEKGKLSKVLILVKASGLVELVGNKVIIKDDLTGDPTGENLEKFFQGRWKDDNPEFYEATYAPGSGAPPSAAAGSRPHVTPELIANLSFKEYEQWRKEGKI